ncbi:MAG TPA: co-chaperone GroES [Candidatus Marinimicrobia bacterium]|jgi:chaperonin GroES|nr:co-chaperone GroES [Candidatus Neomarinimicrobiota bacterium]|tara:strand:- start:31 stop:441 length:411 start_codon:yes stop_codon:yes gene_type:complete
MSKLIVPEHVAIAREKKKQEEEMVKVPNPTGWRIVILPHKGVEKTKGGVILSDQLIQEQQWTTNVGLVLKLGPLAYRDKKKFPTGPWCKEQDWVIFARYAGSRLKIDGGELRILNDDEILGVVNSPEDVLNASLHS